MKAVAISPTAADPAGRMVFEALIAHHWQVTAAVPERQTRRGETETQVAGERGGIRMVPIPHRGRAKAGREPRWRIPAIRRLLSEVRPDVVHVDAEPTARLAALATGLADALGVASVAVTWQSLPRPLSRRERGNRTRTLAHVGGVIAGTEAAAEMIRGARPEVPVVVIPEPAQGIPSTVPDRPDDRFALAFAGRLVPERGLDLLFQACTRVSCPWTLTVLGTGPGQEVLERQAERLGIASRVSWRGGLPAELRHAVWPDIDCLIMPSRATPEWTETKTPVLLEAMSYGVAVIGADTGALPMIIGEAGTVVSEGDVDALGAALEQMADPQHRRTAGRAARARVLERFAPGPIAGQTAAFWQTVARRRASRRPNSATP